MDNKYDDIDNIILGYFKNKEVPSSVKNTIEKTVVKKDAYNFSTYVKRIAIVLIVPVLFATVYGFIRLNKNDNIMISDNRNNELSNTTIEEKLETTHEYPIAMTADYAIGTWPEELYKHADLVIIGKYVKNNKCFAKKLGMIVTESEFKVSKVLKGNYSLPKINLNYYGGTVPLKEYINSLVHSQIIKRGYDKLTEAEIDGKTMENAGLKVYSDAEYVIFLSYDETDGYFVMCDGYGMREVKGGKIYNLDTKTFDTELTDLK